MQLNKNRHLEACPACRTRGETLRFHFAGFGIPWPALSVSSVVNGVLLLALALDFQLPTYQPGVPGSRALDFGA